MVNGGQWGQTRLISGGQWGQTRLISILANQSSLTPLISRSFAHNFNHGLYFFYCYQKVRLVMGKSMPMELTKIKKMVADIREFPTKIDSAELAKNARDLLKKYALLSEKIERNVLIRGVYQKDLTKIRTEEFKAVRRTLKEKANSVLHAKNNKSVKSEKLAKKTVKKPTPTKTSKAKTSKAADVKVAKKSDSKKAVKKSSPKPRKATAPKEDA